MQLPFDIVLEPPSRADVRGALRARKAWAAAAGLLVGAALAIWVGLGRIEGAPAFAARWAELTGFLAGRTGDSTHASTASSGMLAGGATVQVDSAPADAAVELDGRVVGWTPAILSLAPGVHQTRLRRGGYADAIYSVVSAADAALALRAELWRRSPVVRRLLPPFPGAAVATADFLNEGSVALTIAPGAGNERQLWVLGVDGSLHRAGPPSMEGSASLSADGTRAAYLARARRQSPVALSAAFGDFTVGDGRLDEVWIASAHGADHRSRVYSLPPTATGERLVDLTWSPDGQRLLIISRQQAGTGANRTRLLSVSVSSAADTAAVASGSVEELAVIPAEVVPASYEWSLAGDRVAFVARAGSVRSLCLLTIIPASASSAEMRFRYVADLAQGEDVPSPLLVSAPITWEQDDSRFIYAVPPSAATQTSKPGGLSGLRAGAARTSFAVSSADRPSGRQDGDRISAPGKAPYLWPSWPVWLGDGRVLALTQLKHDGPLTVQLIATRDVTNTPLPPVRAAAPALVSDLSAIPAKGITHFAARWDASHAQALIVVSRQAGFGAASASRPEYWLVRFGEFGAGDGAAQ